MNTSQLTNIIKRKKDQNDTQKIIFDFDSLSPLLGIKKENESKPCVLGEKNKCR
jgi:hypothetical protein